MNFWQHFLEYGYMTASGVTKLCSLLAFKRNYDFHWKLYSIFLCCYFLMECVAFYLSRQQIENHWLYNPFVAANYLVEAFLFYHFLTSSFLKKLIRLYAVCFLIFIFINWMFLQPVNRLHTNTMVIGGSFSILLSIAYFIQLYNSSSTVNVVKDGAFWLSAALVLNYAAEVPFMGLLNYLWENYKNFTYFYFIYIMNIIFIIVHAAIIIAFFYGQRRDKEQFQMITA